MPRQAPVRGCPDSQSQPSWHWVISVSTWRWGPLAHLARHNLSPWDNSRHPKKMTKTVLPPSVQMYHLERQKHVAWTVAERKKKPVTKRWFRAPLFPACCGAESVFCKELHWYLPPLRCLGLTSGELCTQSSIVDLRCDLEQGQCRDSSTTIALMQESDSISRALFWLIYHTAWPTDSYSCVASTTNLSKVEVFKCNINHVENFWKGWWEMASVNKQVFWLEN